MADIDPDRFGQVLTNLLANAVRHAPRDSRVSVSIDVVRGARMQREIIVTNECEPIAPTIAHRLFEPFVQGAAHSGSVGLGLTIVHALVAAHGGTIAIDVDAAARGTARFSIELPAPARARVESTTSAGRVHAAARLAAVES
jgi:two-component system OmpR family sensor kinase